VVLVDLGWLKEVLGDGQSMPAATSAGKLTDND